MFAQPPLHLINPSILPTESQNAWRSASAVVEPAMNSQDLPAKDAPLTVNEQVTLGCRVKHTGEVGRLGGGGWRVLVPT